MENNNEMKINKLPAKTWYWLRMNDTDSYSSLYNRSLR